MADGSLRTKLLIACAYDRTEVAATLLDANPDLVNQAREPDPIYMALHFGEFGIVRVLSSYGASRLISFAANQFETLANIATRLGHHELAAWLAATRNWTPLHHLEFHTRGRTRKLLRDGADIHAEVKPFGVTPLSIAQDVEAAARPVIQRAFLHGFAASRTRNALRMTGRAAASRSCAMESGVTPNGLTSSWMSPPSRSSARVRSSERNSTWWSSVQLRVAPSQAATSWWPRAVATCTADSQSQVPRSP